MAVEVPRTLEYMGDQLNVAHLLEWKISQIGKRASQRKPKVQWPANERKAAYLDQRLKSLIMSILPKMNYVINCLTAKSTWEDLILYHEGLYDVKESRDTDLKLCYNTFKFKEGENLTQTFTRYKALMNELVNDGIKLLKLEINTGFINGLPKKWLSFCQSLRNIIHVKESELAFLFGKLNYEENLIDNSPDDEEDIRSSQEYLNDLKEEYQARALLAKSKRFFKKESKKSSGAKATEETQCHKCGRKGHFERDCFSKTPVPSFSSPFLNNTQPNSINPSKHKLKLKADKDFKSKYNKVKARLALLSPVSSDKDELVDVKSLMALGDEERVPMSKEDVRNGEWVQTSVKKVHTLLELEDNDDRKAVLNHLCSDLRYVKEQRNNLLSKHKDLNTKRTLPSESQMNTTNPSVVVTDSSASEYDLADESSVYSIPLPPLEKLGFAKVNRKASALNTNLAPAVKLKNVKIEDDLPFATIIKEINDLKLQVSKIWVDLLQDLKSQDLQNASFHLALTIVV
ncbi:retrovirus-related pol polyprotein from transposon TNT 1-94 [Tanacetum coccineum]